jgi:CheY-like chemotaxis protein
LNSGSQAVTELSKRNREGKLPQALVVDFTLPDGTGWELIEAVRRRSEYDAVGLVLLTSGQSLSLIGQGLDFERVMKPIKPRELREALAGAVGEKPIEVSEAVPAKAEPARGLRILVAEDNPVNQRLAQGLLEKQQHVVTIAGNGVEAVNLAAAGQYDLILMDVQMPQMDGIEATRRIRATASQVPIVALTAHATDDVRRACLESGMTDFLAKPIRREQLYRLIDALTGRQSEESLGISGQSAETPGTVDWRHSLETVGGDRELLAEIIQVFLRERDELWRLLEQALESGDARAFRRAAHSFRGSLLHLGAGEARQIAEQLELLGQAGDLDRARQKLEEFRAALAALVAELKTFVTSQP